MAKRRFNGEQRSVLKSGLPQKAAAFYKDYGYNQTEVKEAEKNLRTVLAGIAAFRHLDDVETVLRYAANNIHRDSRDAGGYLSARDQELVRGAAQLSETIYTRRPKVAALDGGELSAFAAIKRAAHQRVRAAHVETKAGLWDASEHYRLNQQEYVAMAIIEMTDLGIAHNGPELPERVAGSDHPMVLAAYTPHASSAGGLPPTTKAAA